MLAGGSNVVLADDLADLTVVLLANTEITVEGNIVRAEAGAVWDDVVVTSLAHGLGGLECLSGIPGSAGATPVQNVGAYGAEVADTSAGSDCSIAAPVRTAGSGPRRSVRLPHKHPQAFAMPRSCWRWSSRWTPTGRSAPLRYGELAAALRRRAGDRAPTRRGSGRRCCRCARGKGMVLDAEDHDTWSVGLVLHQPRRRAGRVRTAAAPAIEPARCRTTRRRRR